MDFAGGVITVLVAMLIFIFGVMMSSYTHWSDVKNHRSIYIETREYRCSEVRP